MASKFVVEHVENGRVEIDGEAFYSLRTTRAGEYWFRVFYDSEGVRVVLGMYPSPKAKWSIWMKDLRERCSLGAIET